MATAVPTPEQYIAATSPPMVKSQRAAMKRVLACVLCQQRKVKCDRKFPCANCVKARVQCETAALEPRQRRRRFAERDLLDRLRRYEGLLRQNNISFEPLHPNTTDYELSLDEPSKDSASPNKSLSEGRLGGPDSRSSEETSVKSESAYDVKNFWNAIAQIPNDSDSIDEGGEDEDQDDDSHDRVVPADMREAVIKKAWDRMYQSNDLLLFNSQETKLDISTFHPEHIHIFRLWQIYLENVDPLLKITHTPTLQTQIINAASNVTNISPTFEALMFGIYCVSVMSLAKSDCQKLFGSPRQDLLTRYRFGCQQALQTCGLLRCTDRDCLTALFLYLVSVESDTDPRSISSLLGIAMRIAHRMGIHNESSYIKCTAFEAEMRRRLWWSLSIFDNRVCEKSEYKLSMLGPTWDCNIPLNVNDFDIRPEMKNLPANYEKPTEALFAVVRSQLADFVRQSAFHLDFTNPYLLSVAKDTRHGLFAECVDLSALERRLDDKYVQFCNPENPLQFMTIWTTRGYIAKMRLLEYYREFSKTVSSRQTDLQLDAAIAHATRMLECDTKLMTSSLTKGYRWLLQFNFPFPAYLQIIQDLKSRPSERHVEETWNTVSDNYEARSMHLEDVSNPFYKLLSEIVVQAWGVREAKSREHDKSLNTPRIVSDIKQKMMTTNTSPRQRSDTKQPTDFIAMAAVDDISSLLPMDFGHYGVPYNIGGHDFIGSATEGFMDTARQSGIDLDMDQSGFNAADWNPMYGRGW